MEQLNKMTEELKLKLQEVKEQIDYFSDTYLNSMIANAEKKITMFETRSNEVTNDPTLIGEIVKNFSITKEEIISDLQFILDYKID